MFGRHRTPIMAAAAGLLDSGLNTVRQRLPEISGSC